MNTPLLDEWRKGVEKRFIVWALSRDDDWWEEGQGHVSIWDIRIMIDFFKEELSFLLHQSYEQGKRNGKQKMLIKVVQWMNKQGYEGLQEEFVNALTKEEKV